MEPTEYDIRREVEALKDLRRRSTAPGALTLDPDLPNQGPPSPTSPYRSPDAGSSSSPRSPTDQAQGSTQGSGDDPFHLFWVPASLHPEIAPAEFRAFLKEHARNPPSDDDPNPLQRVPSSASNVSSGLGRKKSMLSRQYQPSEKDDSADDTVVPLRRNRSIFSSNQNQGPQLTISDLQKLEELAEEASTSDDPSKLRNILRRSLSLNVSPLALDDTDLGDEADQPIVGAGKFLRRTPRTRIRKPNLPGDGGGHRFGERRRGPSGRSATSPVLQRTSSDVSSSDHGESVESITPRARTTFSDEGPPPDRPDSFSEEVLIYDAYARDEEDDVPPPPTLPPVLITSSPPSTLTEFADVPPPQPESPPREEAPPVPDPALLEALPPVIHQPQPTRLLSPSPSDPYQQGQPPAPPSRTPSPSDFEPVPSPDAYSPSSTPTNSPPASSFLSTSPSPRKEKDKKGLFGKWGGDKEKEKSSKASKKERERAEKEKERREKERREKEQREKDSGFFGSLFGSKKKHDAPAETTSSLHGGREAAQALLGQSQRAPKSPGPPSPMGGMPGMMGGAGGINNYSRYPIHVERAIYRLSHIKLANPRRPLYEQVLISNLMFWYLGVINKAQAAAQAEQAAQAAQANGQPVGAGQPEGEKERLERERVEREAAQAAQERAEKERMERERLEREQRERAEREQWEMEKKKRDASPRRGALTKAAPPGAGPQQRRAEMPVKGPQYEMQHRVMEKEYAGYNGNGAMRSNAPGPVGVGQGPGSGQTFPRQQSPTSPKFNQQQIVNPQQGPEQHYYYSPGEAIQQQQQQQRLPPGAMAPVDQSTWLVGQAAPARKQTGSSPPPTGAGAAPQRRSRSPPPPNMNHSQQPMPVYNPDGGQGGARLGGRSLSATAVPSPSPPPTNGKIRKGQSAYAGTANTANGRRQRTTTGDMSPPMVNGAGGGGGEEEDMPLAVWQRQQRR
ncbi:Zds-C domain-containing protein [Mycena venus]|uniref:Zds-C domain-containing protein n=1 Tax=Mycena venus TaxID=2733690 RepID=A0A8H7D2I4_9AGAR|nr:Zds-C domain-containing protein [Mycena venus]